MATAFLFLTNGVIGSQLILSGFFLCIVLCMVLGLLFPCNRHRRGCTRLFTGFLLSGSIADVILLGSFFPSGEYINPGLGGAFLLLLWPGALTITLIAVSLVNFQTLKAGPK